MNDIDPEEVRRRLDYVASSESDPVWGIIYTAAREWLRLREQPAVGCFRCNERTDNIVALCDGCAASRGYGGQCVPSVSRSL